MKRIEKNLSDDQLELRGKVVDNYVTLTISGAIAHYWSPALNFRVEEDQVTSGHSVVSGLIGPRPEVWTMFMFVYFAIAVIGFFIFSYGVAKFMLGGYNNFLLALPLTILLMLTAYRVGKYGETLATAQTELLKQFVRDSINVSENYITPQRD